MISIDFNCRVLTTGHWPNESKVNQNYQHDQGSQEFKPIEIVRLPQEIK